MKRIGTMNVKEILQHRHGIGLTRAQGRVERGSGGRYRFLGAVANEAASPTASPNL